MRNKWKHEKGWIQLFQQRQKIPDDSTGAGKITASENNREKQDTEGERDSLEEPKRVPICKRGSVLAE